MIINFGREKAYATKGLHRWGYFFFGELHIGSKARALVILKAVDGIIKSFNKETISFLDAGCGKGAYSFYLSKLSPKYRITGYDYDPTVIAEDNKIANKLSRKNLRFEQADLQSPTSDQTFDIIISVEVFEHIQDDQTAFDNIHQMLAPSGYFLVHVPKIYGKHLFKNAGGDPIVSLENKPNYRVYHERQGYSPAELRRKLTVSGFSNIEIVQTVGLLGTLAYDIFYKLILGKKNLNPWMVGLYIFLFPLLTLLIIVDRAFPISNGLGLLAIAKKAA